MSACKHPWATHPATGQELSIDIWMKFNFWGSKSQNPKTHRTKIWGFFILCFAPILVLCLGQRGQPGRIRWAPNGIQTVIPKMFHFNMENYDKPYATIKLGGIQTIFRPEYIHLQWVQFQTDSKNTTFVSALSGLWHRHPEEIASSCNASRIQGSWNSRLRNAYLVVPRLIARYIRVGYAWFDLSSAIFDGFPKLCWRWVCPTRRLMLAA